ncbi:MAG: HAMP domain-containing protein [Alphaproteobacteria bacterium]|jgi:two-component system nitrogen regulation sensor histidine kinase NtrY|nr:HAMP domain-containing protein [Alphaproteobacteria bacterium]UCM94077.1 MAG: HAMP domain-containing protein [Candidatus Megaira endosymbiont of Mesostigma viride]HJK87825.1 ATP-binding protein [Candidatus Megaira endosymbiont of Mesostigma viride]
MFLKKFWQSIVKHRYSKNVPYTIIAAAVIFLLINSFFVYLEFQYSEVDPVSVIGLMLIILVGSLLFVILLLNNPVSSLFSFIKRTRKRAYKLRKRIIIAFSFGAAVPTIIVAVFSTYFFNFGVQSWFDDKVSRVLEQSIIVGESYINEHIMQLKETAISISDDYDDLYYKLVYNPELFQEILTGQAEMRTLDEAIIFKKDTNTILAQTALSFSLSFLAIPSYVFDKASKGEVVQISSDPTKLRILIKLRNYNDTYLLIGRLIDEKIIDHINRANGTAQEYFRLKGHIFDLQVKFAMIFILLAIILLLAAIIWGRHFAEQLVKPIRELVIAAEKVKNGDLTAQVPEEGLKKDEIKILSLAFNRMVKQIDRQQRDLLIAQRALAWSDVARKVAHEIKNPLTPIHLGAEMLLKKFKNQVQDQDSFEKYINNIIKNSNEIRMIVSEFVNFARLPSPDFSKHEIVSIINQLVDERRLINDKILYQVFSNVKLFELVCDGTQLNRVLVNLLQNAEHALENISYQQRITVHIMLDGDFIAISVLDNGLGFSPHVLENATKAYFTTKAKGTGLGLAIVDKIVQDHLGTLNIFNREEGGGCVKLTFNAKELRVKLK